MPPTKNSAPAPASNALLSILENRFAQHPERHPGVAWSAVLSRLTASPTALASLALMEESGGEPDVIGVDAATGAVTFYDCSAESPKGRRSLCYDDDALEARKQHKPAGSAQGWAAEARVQLLTEEEYRALQTLGQFDLKTSSWIATPAPVRKLGGALFCDRRFGLVFVYHNGVESYYGSRGFRTKLVV